MSKIGIKPVTVLAGTDLQIAADRVSVKGPKGEVSILVPHGITVTKQENTVTVARKGNDKKIRAIHGLVRMLIDNAIKGVNELWAKELEIQGVGFRAALESGKLVCRVGYSHPVVFDFPSDVTIEVKNNHIIVKGVDKQRVGEIAAKIKDIRKPDKYKGKGIRYLGEVIKLKPGKKAKTGA